MQSPYGRGGTHGHDYEKKDKVYITQYNQQDDKLYINNISNFSVL